MCAIAQNPAGLQKQAQTPRIHYPFLWWVPSEVCVAVATCYLSASTSPALNIPWDHLLSVHLGVQTGQTQQTHISKSETTFPISKLNPAKCWTGFLQLFSSQQMYFPYFHYLGATVYLSSCKRISKSWRNSSGWTRGKKSLLHQLDWKPYLSSSVKSCCLLNHCMNFWSGVMQ